jgi:hypothetical protein
LQLEYDRVKGNSWLLSKFLQIFGILLLWNKIIIDNFRVGAAHHVSRNEDRSRPYFSQLILVLHTHRDLLSWEYHP